MSAPFKGATCGSLRPFPLHAARVLVRGAFSLVTFFWPHKRKLPAAGLPPANLKISPHSFDSLTTNGF